MALTNTALNAMADHLASIATQVSLHSADPGATGASETTAARKTPTWAAASSGALSLSGTLAFTGGTANGACTHVGFWDASANFLGGFAISGGQTFDGTGNYTLNSFTLNGS